MRSEIATMGYNEIRDSYVGICVPETDVTSHHTLLTAADGVTTL